MAHDDDFGVDLTGVQVFADDSRIQSLASYTDYLEELVQVYADAAAGELLDRAPAAGYWSVAQVVHHLADAEMIASVRLRELVVGSEFEWLAWDPETYAGQLLYDVRPPEDALTVVLALRHLNSRLLASLPAEAWLRTASDADGVTVDLAEWVRRSVEQLQAKVLQGRRAVIGMI